MVDEIAFFIAPKVIGSAKNIASAIDLKKVEMKRIGQDMFVKGLICSRG